MWRHAFGAQLAGNRDCVLVAAASIRLTTRSSSVNSSSLNLRMSRPGLTGRLAEELLGRDLSGDGKRPDAAMPASPSPAASRRPSSGAVRSSSSRVLSLGSLSGVLSMLWGGLQAPGEELRLSRTGDDVKMCQLRSPKRSRHPPDAVKTALCQQQGAGAQQAPTK
jgi:hypothetical protein